MVNRLQRKIIEDAAANYYILNEWERGFIRGLQVFIKDETFEITETVNKKLNEINNKLIKAGI